MSVAISYCVKCDKDHDYNYDCTVVVLPQLTLKNAFVRNGHQRVNTLKLKVDKSGALLIYINTGHSRDTDKKNYSLFVCELGNIEKLKDFLKKV